MDEAHGGLISYPFPLRQGGPPARFNLPPDLKRDEVRRITRMLESLCVDKSPQEAITDYMISQQRAMQNINPSPFGGYLSGLGKGIEQPPPKMTRWQRVKNWYHNLVCDLGLA